MSQLSVPPSTKGERIYTIGAKVFLLGEYAVLSHLPAVVAAIPPRFSLRVGGEANQQKPFSTSLPVPLERLRVWVQQTAERFPKSDFVFPDLIFSNLVFNDPFEGQGGFGASSAQFALGYAACSRFLETLLPELFPDNKIRHWKTVWNLYRELMAFPVSDPSYSVNSKQVLPSGADLVAQWQGGVTFFDPSDGHCQDVWPLFDWSNLLVFSATHQSGRKVATHEHLDQLYRTGFPQNAQRWLGLLEKKLILGIQAIQNNDPAKFGQSLNDYAEILFQEGLEAPATTEDRKFLKSLPGVLGVKGTGALQSDGIVVFLGSSNRNSANRTSNKDQVIHAVRERGLSLLCDGLTCEMGVACQTLT